MNDLPCFIDSILSFKTLSVHSICLRVEQIWVWRGMTTP